MTDEKQKRRRDDETTCALRVRFAQFCARRTFAFNVFTDNRHNVVVRIDKIKTSQGHALIAVVNNQIRIMKKEWIIGAHGYCDFEHALLQVRDLAKKVRNCKHCARLCLSNDICARCLDFVVSPFYAECIACKCEDHPISWQCLTCVDARYCTACHYTCLKNGMDFCPMCKEKTLNDEMHDDTDEDDDEDSDLSDEEDAKQQHTYYDRVFHYILYNTNSGHGKVSINQETLMELRHLTRDDLHDVCEKLAKNGYSVYLCIKQFPDWCICVVLDEVEITVPPLTDAVFYEPYVL